MTQPEEMQHWTADQVAECLPYHFIHDRPGNELYEKLWDLVKAPSLREEPIVEEQSWWDQLTEDEQKCLADAWDKQEAEV